MIDSHCHLADDKFLDDRAAVVERAMAAGVTRALCVIAADNEVEVARGQDLLQAWPTLSFGVGIHPHNAAPFAGREDEAAAQVRSRLAQLPRTSAIGEIGLDYHYDFAPRAVQQNVFRAQLLLARELNLPIIIHTREAEDDTLAILREAGSEPIRGVLHCFTGTERLAAEGLALGLHVSFAGIITFPKAENLRAIAAKVPADRLLAETDSPYLAPVPHRGKRNEPALVVKVAEQLAAARNEAFDAIERSIETNFDALFRS